MNSVKFLSMIERTIVNLIGSVTLRPHRLDPGLRRGDGWAAAKLARGVLLTVSAFAAIAAATVFVPLAQAQIAPDAGAVQREQQRRALDAPARAAPPVLLDQPVRPAMAPSGTRFTLTAVRISGNTVFDGPELVALLQDMVGKDVDFPDLDGMSARISRHYRQRGYLVARAYLPAQDIRDGVVEIAVVEGRFGRIEFKNDSRVDEATVRRHTQNLPGLAVQERDLERKLLLLNDLSGLGEARASLRPGEKVGESDLDIELTAAPLISGGVEYDNHGNRFVGAHRLSGQLNVASPLGLGDSLSARATKGIGGLEHGRIAYETPLGGDGLKAGLAYTASRYELGKTFAPLLAHGDSATRSLHLAYPLVRAYNFSLVGRLTYDWSSLLDRVDSTATVIEKNTRGATLSLSGDARDGWGGGGISAFSLAYGSGRLDIESAAALAIDAASARTQGGYSKWSYRAQRSQALGERTSLFVSLAGQKASKNLDSSEKFSLGGAGGVRAYPVGEATGDSGYLASAELRYSFALGAGLLQPFGFIDAGGVRLNERPFAAGANQRSLSGAGVGVLWVTPEDFQLKLTIASRLGSQAATSDTDRHVRAWLQASKSF